MPYLAEEVLLLVVVVLEHAEGLPVAAVDGDVAHVAVVQRPAQLAGAARVGRGAQEEHGQPQVDVLGRDDDVALLTGGQLAVQVYRELEMGLREVFQVFVRHCTNRGQGEDEEKINFNNCQQSSSKGPEVVQVLEVEGHSGGVQGHQPLGGGGAGGGGAGGGGGGGQGRGGDAHLPPTKGQLRSCRQQVVGSPAPPLLPP